MSSQRARTYNTRKLQKEVGDRDGWTCYHCGISLVPSWAWYQLFDLPLSQVYRCRPASEWGYKESMKRGARCATVDHIIPHSLGGSDRPDNLVLSCRDCNSLRRTHPIEERFGADT